MCARGTVSLAPLAFLFALTVTLAARTADAQEIRDQLLPECGICYPGGYDINTFGEVKGTIVDFTEPDEGPVRFVIAGADERWVVLASPKWFWESTAWRCTPGETVTVRGSKTLGADGTMYLVAREIQPPGAAPAVTLRDRRGAPLWSGSHRGSRIPGGAAADCRGPGAGRGRGGGAGRR